MSKTTSRMHDLASRMLQAFLLMLCRLAFRPKLSYSSEKAREAALREPQVLLCNHVRGMDGAVIYACFRRQSVTAISAKDVKQTFPILNWLYRFLPVLEIDRENVSLAWLRDSRRLLREGQHIMIFAEGKCNRARVLQPLKPGAVLLAASAGVQITPIYHNGEYHPFFGPRFRVIIGEPITLTPPPEGVSQEVMAQEADMLFNVMHDLEYQLNGFIRRA